MRRYFVFYKKKCRIYAAFGVSQTPNGDAIGGKEIEGERSIATLTQSVGIPIYDKDLRISADDLKIGDIVELKYIDTSIEQGALSPFRGYEGILLVKEIVKVKPNLQS